MKKPVRQNLKRIENKKHIEKHGAALHWLATSGHGPCPGVVDMLSVTKLEKTDFPSSGKNQLQTAFWLRMGLNANLPSSVLGFYKQGF